jgi:hypothetical protein
LPVSSRIFSSTAAERELGEDDQRHADHDEHAAQQVGAAAGAMHLQDLRERLQVAYGVAHEALGDLQGEERQDRGADAGRPYGGAEVGDHSAGDQLVEAGL